MKTRARRFLEHWLAVNIPQQPTEPALLVAEVEADLKACLRSAAISGISRSELEEECDPRRLILAFRRQWNG